MWHEYAMHPSNAAMSNALKNGVVVGCDLTADDISNANAIFGECPYCIMGKITSQAHPPSDRPPAQAPGEILHADILVMQDVLHETTGKPTPQYGLIAVDEHSGYMMFRKIDSKQLKDVLAGLLSFRTTTRVHGRTLKGVQTDSESVLLSCLPGLAELSIKLMVVPAYQHAQRIERAVRTLKDRERCVLASTPVVIPRYLQGEVYTALVTHINDLPRSTDPHTTPRIIFEGRKLNLERRLMIPLGTPIMVNRARAQHAAGEPRALLGIALGPAPHSDNAIQAYVFHTKRVIVSNDQTVFSEVPADFPLAKNTLYSPLGNRLNLQLTAELSKRQGRRNADSRPLRSSPLLDALNVSEQATGVTVPAPAPDQRGGDSLAQIDEGMSEVRDDASKEGERLEHEPCQHDEDSPAAAESAPIGFRATAPPTSSIPRVVPSPLVCSTPKVWWR